MGGIDTLPPRILHFLFGCREESRSFYRLTFIKSRLLFWFNVAEFEVIRYIFLRLIYNAAEICRHFDDFNSLKLYKRQI